MKEAGTPNARCCLALLLALAACGGTDDAPNAVDASVAGAPLALEETPAIVIGGGQSPAHVLDGVVTPFLLPNGDVAVPLTGAAEIRIFDPSGAHLRTLGRKGSGPGEFEYLLAAWARGDTIEALDMGLRRITRFLPSGQVEVIQLNAAVNDVGLGPGPLGRGWAVGGVVTAGAGQRDAMEIHAVDARGEELRKVADLAGIERFNGPDGMTVSPLAAFSHVSVAGGRVFTADARTGTVQVFDTAGAMVGSFTVPAETIHDPAKAVADVVDSAVARAGPGEEAAMRRRWEAAPVPQEVPRIAALVADSLGFAWILPYDPYRHSFVFRRPATGGTWTVRQADGQVVGRIDVPAQLEPESIGGSALVGIARDSMGVETVQVYRLTRR